MTGEASAALFALAAALAGAFLLMSAHGVLLYALARKSEQLAFASLAIALLFAHAALSAHALPELSGLGAMRSLWPLGLLAVLVCAVLFELLRPDLPVADWYRRPPILPPRASASAALAGTLLTALALAGYLPRYAPLVFAAPLVACVYLIFCAGSLALRLDSLRENISGAQEELSAKVSNLEDAVARATENTERAEQAARVKDEFMATMSHELRTPLNAIINLPPGLLRDFPVVHQVSCARCQALFELEPGEDPNEARTCPECPGTEPLTPKQHVRYQGAPENTLRYLEKIERSGTHLLQVVNGILDAEQVKTGQLALTFGEADIAELTREVIDEMSDLAERGGVALALENVPDGARTVVDRLRLRQVLINLISNAIKFSDRRGTVRVSVQAASDGFRFAVKDEGIGIAPENLETVFGSFEQVHQAEPRKFGGTGLGLFISRSLVRKHGGEMWVESTLGRGATFRFHIPRRERARSTANLRDSQVFSFVRPLN